MRANGPADDNVGKPEKRDDGQQHPEQQAILGAGGEDGLPEPKTAADWAARGATERGTPGRPPVAPGGSSQGHSDKKPV